MSIRSSKNLPYDSTATQCQYHLSVSLQELMIELNLKVSLCQCLRGKYAEPPFPSELADPWSGHLPVQELPARGNNYEIIYE